MNQGISERDWKIFRELYTIAEERLCARILTEARVEIDREGTTAEQRYRELLGVIDSGMADLERGFDAPSRSNAFSQLVIIHHLGLLTGNELRRFSAETLAYVEAYGPIPPE